MRQREWNGRGLLARAAVATVMLLGAVSFDAPKTSAHYLYDYGYSSYSYKAYTRAYGYDYGCGLKDCARTENAYGYVRPYGSYNAQRTQMRMVHGFSGVGLSVGVSSSGASASFSDWGSSCGQGWVLNYNERVSYTANGEICKANTWGWVSKIWAKTEGQYRIGSYNWYGVNAYDSVKVGGF